MKIEKGEFRREADLQKAKEVADLHGQGSELVAKKAGRNTHYIPTAGKFPV